MEKDFCNDLYSELKIEGVKLFFLLEFVKREVLLMVFNNSWLLRDNNLSQSFIHLNEMVNISSTDLEELLVRLDTLDNSLVLFDINDLVDELTLVMGNIYLENEFLVNMKFYIDAINNSKVSTQEITVQLEKYLEKDISCYNEMRMNNEDLKRLRKERRDYFE